MAVWLMRAWYPIGTGTSLDAQRRLLKLTLLRSDLVMCQGAQRITTSESAPLRNAKRAAHVHSFSFLFSFSFYLLSLFFSFFETKLEKSAVFSPIQKSGEIRVQQWRAGTEEGATSPKNGAPSSRDTELSVRLEERLGRTKPRRPAAGQMLVWLLRQ